MPTEKKPKLIFIPHYLGSLRYFDKLRPFLIERYEVVFLLLPLSGGKYLLEMKDYCQQAGLNNFSISLAKTNVLLSNISLYQELVQAFIYKKEIKSFLSDPSIKKIISVNDCGFPLDYLLDQANQVGIDTMVLQWALYSPGQSSRPVFVSTSIMRRQFYRLRPIYNKIRKKLLEIIMRKKLKVSKAVFGSGSAKKMGIINKDNFNRLKKIGISEEKMSIVGYLDFYLAAMIKKEIKDDINLKNFLNNKYKLNPIKKKIIVFSSCYNKKDVTFLNDKQQYTYIKSVFDDLFYVFPRDQFDFLLKIHPAEDMELYLEIEKSGVKIFDKQADNFELIALSDLYLADSTTTNFIPIIMEKDCIFFNFLKLDIVELTKDSFGIKRFFSNREKFIKILKDFLNGHLEKQYFLTENIYTDNSMEKIIQWIG